MATLQDFRNFGPKNVDILKLNLDFEAVIIKGYGAPPVTFNDKFYKVDRHF